MALIFVQNPNQRPMTLKINDLLSTYGQEWNLLSCSRFPAHDPASGRLLQPSALLRPGPARGLRQELTRARRPPRPTHALGPRVVPAVSGLPRCASSTCRRRARDDGGGPALRLHARRPARDGGRLPRDPASGRAADQAADRRGAARRRPLADPRGRVPQLGRVDRAQPRDRLAPGGGARRSDGRRLPAGHVRPRRADAADPPPRGSHRRGGLARRPRRGRSPPFPLGGPGRVDGARGVPRRRLRQRRLPARRARAAGGAARDVRRVGRPLLRRRRPPRHVRHRPPGALAGARRARRARQRRAEPLPDRDRDARRLPGPPRERRAGSCGSAASSGRRPARTCSSASPRRGSTSRPPVPGPSGRSSATPSRCRLSTAGRGPRSCSASPGAG